MDAQVSKIGQSTSAQQSPQTFVPLHKVILVGCAAFSILIVLQTLTRISDSGDSAPPFLDLLLRITLSYPPWLAFAVTLFAVLERRAHLMASPRAVVRVFLLSHLLFYAPNVIYEVSLDALSEGDTLASVPQRILAGIRRLPVRQQPDCGGVHAHRRTSRSPAGAGSRGSKGSCG